MIATPGLSAPFHWRHRLLTAALLCLVMLPSGAVVIASEQQNEVVVQEGEDESHWSFQPPEVRIGVNERLVWTNTGLDVHFVAADDGSFDSGLLDSGQRYERQFGAPGIYSYHCAIHPQMAGLVVVEQSHYDETYFPETGFAVEAGAFASFFRARGGVRTIGYPISRVFMLRGFRVQLFQRFALQQSHDGAVRVLNLLDSGLLPYTRFNGSTVPPPDADLVAIAPSPSEPDYSDAVTRFVREHAPDVVDDQPVEFGRAFFASIGCADAFPMGECEESLLPLMALELWGLPTSRPARDPANGSFVYQRFQRGVLHFDATTGDTQGLLLGEVLKSVLTGEGLAPDVAGQAEGSPLLRQYQPGQPGWVARPWELPESDLTEAFSPPRL